MIEAIETQGMGWLPDYPDFRDYTADEAAGGPTRPGEDRGSVPALLAAAGVSEPSALSLPTRVDLRGYCSPIEHQGQLGSCSAHAGVGLFEYFERRAFGKHIDASRLFLYKVARRIANLEGDSGVYLRSTMGALALFGVPPERFWPYDIARFDEEPPSFCYAFALNYQAVQYYRLDPPGTDRRELLRRVKANLAAALPSMFGFTVYPSISQATRSGQIPFPTNVEGARGGHAVVAVGYDDERVITNSGAIPAVQTTGALLIRNSWGTGWGEGGYGWLPYDYVRRGLAIDWWSLIKGEWIDTGAFQTGPAQRGRR